MPSLETLNATGHLTLSWDPDKPGDVERAKAEFDRLRGMGYAFFSAPESANPISRVTAAAYAQAGALDVRLVRTREFQPRARTVAVRPMQGG